MNSTTFDVGPVPYEESCAQLGSTPDFSRVAKLECAMHRAVLIALFGQPPEGVTIRTRSNPHDFGTYYDTVVQFDSADAGSAAYATRIDENAPARWDDAGFSAPVIYGDRAAAVTIVHSCLEAAVESAIRTLGQYPDQSEQAAMRANLIAAFPAVTA